jgi:DNA invertase Pin-like site-specific DNA recombinase
MNKTFYYASDFSTSQSLDTQIEAFRADGADDKDIVIEKEAGKPRSRSEYKTMKEHMLSSGDTLVVMSLDKLGRSKKTITEELRWYKDHDIRVRILDIPMTSYIPPEGQEWVLDVISNVLIEVLASQAEQERILRRKQAEGIAMAKAEGKYTGRNAKPIDEKKLRELNEQYLSRHITKAEMARQLGISRPTLDRVLKKRGLFVQTSGGKIIDK